MTVDPNNQTPPDPQLELEPAASDPPAAAPVGASVEEIADAVLAKILRAAAPEPEPARTTPQLGNAEMNSIEELQRQATDPEDPRRANAIATLGLRYRAMVDDEWNALGVPVGHPARVLFMQNESAFSGRPMYALQAWENQELRRKVAEAEAGKGRTPDPDPEDAEKERARKVRESAPGMPSRSVSQSPRAGKKNAYDSLEDFRRAAASDPTLDDAYDRGEITIRNY